jgi:hypothetical protein
MLGLIGALGLATPVALGESEAGAQEAAPTPAAGTETGVGTHGMKRRQGRRQSRRNTRHGRREERRGHTGTPAATPSQ